MNHRLKPWSRKQLSPHISPLGLLQKMGWFQNGTLWKLDFYAMSKGRNHKTWKMFFKSESYDKNWKFWSKAIDFSWEIGYYFGRGNWNLGEDARFCQCGWGCSMSSLGCLSFPGCCQHGWDDGPSSLGLWLGIFTSWKFCFGYSSRCREGEELSKSYHLRTTFP